RAAHSPPSFGTKRWYGWRAVPVALALLLTASFVVVAFSQRSGWLGTGNKHGDIALAVLPLKNLSGDAGQDYYADGISEALITELGKIGQLQVLSFQTVSRYRQTAKPLPEI